jgi:hypothetical protein
MEYKLLYESLIEDGNLPNYYKGIWEKDEKLFIEEQEELENNILNFNVLLDDE